MTEESKHDKKEIHSVSTVSAVLDSDGPPLYSTVAVRFLLSDLNKMQIFQNCVAPKFKYHWGMFQQEQKYITWFFMSPCWDKKVQQKFIDKVKETVSVGADDIWTVDRFIMTSSEICPRVCDHTTCHQRSVSALYEWKRYQDFLFE